MPADPLPEPLLNTTHFVFGSSDILMLFVALFLLFLSAFFAGAEVAFFSLSKSELDALHKSNSRGANRAEKLLDLPKELLATILLGKNLINVAFVLLTASLFSKVMLFFNLNFWLIYFINTLLITLFLVFVGESFAKSVAFRNKVLFVKFMSLWVYGFSVLPPFSWLRIPLAKSSGILVKRAKRKGLKISHDDIETVLQMSQNNANSENDYSILQGVLKFGNTEVRQVMCPRIEVVGLDENLTLDEIVKIVVEAGYSRLPVFKESFDNVTGVLFVKDLLPYITRGNDFNWKDLVREPFFVPQNKKIDALLKEFQTKKVHLAVVIDEYGGTCGIVTLEDVIEEIVGDIVDEFDDDEVLYSQLNDTTFLFDARTELDDFYKVINSDGTDFEDIKENAETLNGFITQVAGKVLKSNEFIVVGNTKLIVEVADKKRIKSVKVVLQSA